MGRSASGTLSGIGSIVGENPPTVVKKVKITSKILQVHTYAQVKKYYYTGKKILFKKYSLISRSEAILKKSKLRLNYFIHRSKILMNMVISGKTGSFRLT